MGRYLIAKIDVRERVRGDYIHIPNRSELNSAQHSGLFSHTGGVCYLTMIKI